MRPETSENTLEYIVGEDDKDIEMRNVCAAEEDSTTSDSEDDDDDEEDEDDEEEEEEEEDEKYSKRRSALTVDPELDCGSGSDTTEHSSDSSDYPPARRSRARSHRPPSRKAAISEMCRACGRGPFRSVKLHLLHCTGVKVKHPCSLCKEVFPNEAALKEHYMPLYTCDVCGQVFPLEKLYSDHKCPKGTRSPLVLFCSESRPQPCNICKSFFVSEKSLSNHVNKVHMSVVSTKVCIITNPAALTEKGAQLGVRHASLPAVITPNAANQVINGKFCVGHMNVGSQPAAIKGNSTSLSTSSSQEMLHLDKASATPAAEATRSERSGGNQGQPADQPSSCPSAEPAKPTSAPAPTILAMFENGSHDLARTKRMNMGWRSKAPLPCRQCGAIFRQPSLIISHRYLHRGQRSHQCQCGRTFKHQLHLLRHCVQHAETVSYICASCGETLLGARLLEEHIRGKSGKRSRSGHKWKPRVKRKCRAPLTCDCGQLFFRPSAFIWHQLRNRTKTKPLKTS